MTKDFEFTVVLFPLSLCSVERIANNHHVLCELPFFTEQIF